MRSPSSQGTNPDKFKPDTPIMGGIEQTGTDSWNVWTGGAPNHTGLRYLRVHKHSDGQTLTWHSGKLYGCYGTKSNFGKPKNLPTLCQFLFAKKGTPVLL